MASNLVKLAMLACIVVGQTFGGMRCRCLNCTCEWTALDQSSQPTPHGGKSKSNCCGKSEQKKQCPLCRTEANRGQNQEIVPTPCCCQRVEHSAVQTGRIGLLDYQQHGFVDPLLGEWNSSPLFLNLAMSQVAIPTGWHSSWQAFACVWRL